MKRLLGLMLSLVMSLMAWSQNITFADAKVKSICVQNWDTNGDGELSEDEAAAVTDLGSVFKGNTEITSFNELQYFTGLSFYDEWGTQETFSGITGFAFQGCSNLTQVTLPALEAIGDGAFMYSGLTAITIPNTVRVIRDGAFDHTNISEFVLPASVTDITYGIVGSPSLTSIVVANDNPVYDSRDNCNAIIKTADNQLLIGCANTTIPSTVTSIRETAFQNCKGLQAVVIPDNVTTIGREAFAHSGMTSLSIGKGLSSIGENAFTGLNNLTTITVDGENITYDSRDNCNAIVKTANNTLIFGCGGSTIPASVTIIGENAFWECGNLAAITIPATVTSISNSAFWRCKNLMSVTVEWTEPIKLSASGVFSTDLTGNKATLYVPVGCKGAYEAATGWKEFKEIIEGTPEGNWTNLVANSDMEGTDVSCFFSKEAGKDVDPVSSTIVAGAGKDDSRGIVVDSSDNPEYSWDSQFFVRLPKSLPAGTIYRVSFNYKASRNAEVSTQMHTEPGGYIHWEGVGSINFTTEWQSYEHVGTISVDQSPEDNMQTIAFNLSESSSATTYYFDNFVFEIDEYHITPVAAVKTHPIGKTLIYTGEPQELVTAGTSDEGTMLYQVNWGGFSEAIPTATEPGSYTIDYKVLANEGYIDSKTYTTTTTILPAHMTDLVVNGDMEGDDVTCFFSRENYFDDETVLPSTIVDGAGKDDSRGIVVHSVDNPAEEWTSQFFVRLPKPLPAGTAYKVRFDYKASQEAEVATEAHSEPSKYIHWEGVGNLNFTTDWQTYEHVGTISAEQSPEDNMQTIAFRLSKPQTATTYYFDNFVFEIDSNSPVVDNGEQPGMLCINELMQSNIDCLMDDLNDFPDSWVELYNSGTTPVNLGRYKLGLTNDAASAWQLPAMIIGAGQYVVVYCDKVGEKLHTDFRLDSGKGGSVYLFFDGAVDDKRTNIAKQPAPNISLGYKSETDKTWGYQYEPTPGAANCNMLCTTLLGNPVFSEKGRVLTTGTTLQLELTSTGLPEGTVVRYTLDGSEPTTSSTAYTSPITINKTTTVRAKAFCEGYLTGRSVTQSYIFLDRDMTLPVISLVTDDSYWYDDQIGIIANNTSDKKVDWRRPVNIEFFDAPNTLSKINQLGETRVQGGATRSNHLKSLAIYANKRFGTKRFTYEFFPDQRPGVSEFKSLLLRNAGNDYNDLYMRDAVIQRTMAQHADLDWQGWRPAIVFKNGVYKGMLNIRERSNEDNICSHYQDAKGDELEDIDMIENWWDLKEGDWNNFDSFKAFYNEAGHTMLEYEQWMDCSEFANLMLMNLYYSNRDFPGNNIVMWRPRTADGKWRWIAKDTDFGLGLYGHPADYNTIAWINDHNYDPGTNWANGGEHTVLFRHLMDDASFRKMFLDRASVYMGDFLNERGTRAVWDPMVEMIKDEYPYHRQAGNGWRDWNSYNDELQSARQWVASRTAHFYQQLADFYELGTPTSLTVNKDVNTDELTGVTISMNDIKLSQPLFDGKFHAGRQVTLKAEGGQRPVKGWRIIYLNDNNTQTVRKVAGAEYSFTMPTCKLLTINALFEASEINDSWTNLVVNGDMEGDDVTCFFSKEDASDPYPSIIVAGAGKDGSRGIVLNSTENPENSWDNQFFVRLPKSLPAGTIYRVSFNYKASQNAEVSTQIHTEPGGYIHWEGVGSINFTTEWQSYEHVGTISVDQSPEDNMQTIAFNLSESSSATTYYFDNFVFEIDSDQPIHFADADVKALCVSNWDTNGDGELSFAEAAAVTNEQFANVGFESVAADSWTFDELQYFTGLTVLNAQLADTKISSVKIPVTVTEIGNSAFKNTLLTSITLPHAVKKVGEAAFADCSELVTANLGCVEEIDVNAFIATSIVNLTVPGTVKSVGLEPFSWNWTMKQATLEEGMTKVPETMFHGNVNLTTVTLPSTLTTIEQRAFQQCEALTTISIPAGVTTIDEKAFNKCTSLVEVTVGNPTPVAITEEVFSNRKNATLYVPEGCVAAYKAADYWKEFKKILVVGTTDPVNETDVSQMANAIYMDPVTGRVGRKFWAELKLKNEHAIRAYQFDLELPVGVTVATDEEGEYVYEQGDRHEDIEPTLNYNELSSTYYMSVIDEVQAGEGVVWRLNLKIADGLTLGDYPVVVKNVKFTPADGQDTQAVPDATSRLTVEEHGYLKGDANDDDVVNIADVVCIVNHSVHLDTPVFVETSADVTGNGEADLTDAVKIIDYILRRVDALAPALDMPMFNVPALAPSLEVPNGMELPASSPDISNLTDAIYADDLIVKSGQTYPLMISLKNSKTTNGYQFDLVLPSGVTIPKNDKGKYSCELSSRHKGHTIDVNYVGGVYKVAVYSLSSKALTGNDGAICTIQLNVADDMVDGNYTVAIKEAAYSLTSGASWVSLPRADIALTVKNSVKGDVNNDGKVTITDAVGVVNYILGNPAKDFNEDAADVNGDGNITITDAVGIVNIILSGSPSAPKLEAPEPEVLYDPE